MKTWNLFLCLLCIVFVFCSCDVQKDDVSDVVSVKRPAKKKNTVAVSELISEQPQKTVPLVDIEMEDAEYVSSVRSYIMAELEKKYTMTDAPIISFSDGKLYIYQDSYESYPDGTGSLICYDTNGAYLETVSFPISVEENGRPSAVHRLKNGDILVIYYTFDHTPMFIRRYSMDDMLLAEEKLPEAVENFNNTRVFERETADGTHQILVHMTSAMLVLNESLEVVSYIPYDSDYYNCIPLDETRFLLGHNAAELRILDMKTGQITPNTELIFPDDAQGAQVTMGADGNYYYYNDIGVWQLIKNGESIEVLQWSNGAALPPNTLWMIDDAHLFVTQAVEINVKPKLCYIQCRGEMSDVKRRVITLCSASDKREAQTLLSAAVSAFNASSSTYYIKLEKYSTDIDEAVKQFNEALLSGTAPDLLITDHFFDYKPYRDKGVFVDLLPHFGETFLGGVREAYTIDGQMVSFPLMMQVETLAALSSTVDESLTYAKMRDISYELSDGEYLVSDSWTGSRILANGIYDYIDWSEKSCSFATKEFENLVRLSKDLEDIYLNYDSGRFLCNRVTVGEGYGVTDAQLLVDVYSGKLKFLTVPYHTAHAYAAIKRIFLDAPFTICGYPSSEGYGAWISSDCAISMLADSDVRGGCAEFITFLLSDKMQTSEALNHRNLPVTSSALREVLSQNRYYYFRKKESRTKLNALDVGDAPLVKYANKPAAYVELYITDEEIEQQMDFFENLHMKANMSSVINDILEEELSFWRGGVRSLSDALELAQSRVWIYLNE